MAGKAAVFPSGYAGNVGRPGAAGGKQKGQESRRRSINAGKANNSIKTRLKSIFWCWQYKLSWEAEKHLKRRKTALKRKTEKTEDGKSRKAGSGKQKSRTAEDAVNNPPDGRTQAGNAVAGKMQTITEKAEKQEKQKTQEQKKQKSRKSETKKPPIKGGTAGGGQIRN